MSKESKNDRPSLVGSFRRNARIVGLCFVVLMIGICAGTNGVYSQSDNSSTVQGAAGEPYPNMPSIAPIGVRIGKYLDVPSSSQGPPIDPARGYRVQDLGSGLYMITDNAIQSMFLVYDRGVVVIDAPQNLAAFIPKAIAEVAGDKPITHLIYSHSHADHIGGAKALGGNPIIIAHEETLRLLKRDADPNRPLPTVTFSDKYTLRVGKQVLDLSYHGNAHEPGNIFIYAPAQRVLMVVDVVFPGWMPWRRFALAQDIPGYFAQVEEIRKMDWNTFVGGHVGAHRHARGRGRSSGVQFGREAGGGDGAGLDETGRRFEPARQGQPVGGLRQLHRQGRGAMRQYPHPQVVLEARRLRCLHLGSVLRDGAGPAHRVGAGRRRRGGEGRDGG